MAPGEVGWGRPAEADLGDETLATPAIFFSEDDEVVRGERPASSPSRTPVTSASRPPGADFASHQPHHRVEPMVPLQHGPVEPAAHHANAAITREPHLPASWRPSVRALAAVLVGALILAVAAFGIGRAMNSPTPASTFAQRDGGTGAAIEVGPAVPTPQRVMGERDPDGSATFTWENPDPAVGDWYEVSWQIAGGEPMRIRAEETTATITGPSGPLCVEVTLIRADLRASAQPGKGCAP